MATANQIAMYPIKNLHADNVPYVSLLEASTQSFKKGEPVFLSGGYVTVCASATYSVILGIAAEDAHNITAGTQRVGVYLADAQTIFCGNVCNNATYASNTAVTAQGNVGGSFGLIVSTTPANKWSVANGTTTPSSCRVAVVDLDDRDAVGDTGGRVHFVFLSNYYQMNSTS